MTEQPKPSLTEPPFDGPTALARVEGDVDLLCELAEVFLETVDSLLDDVRGAVANREHEQLVFRAHRLKSSLSNFFARDTSMAAAKLEQIGRDRDWQGVACGLRELEGALERLIPALQTLVATRRI